MICNKELINKSNNRINTLIKKYKNKNLKWKLQYTRIEFDDYDNKAKQIEENIYYWNTKDFFAIEYYTAKSNIGYRKLYYFSPYLLLCYFYIWYIFIYYFESSYLEIIKKLNSKSIYIYDWYPIKNFEFTNDYRKYYSEFTNKYIELLFVKEWEEKTCIELDIKDYYDNVNISELFKLISKNILLNSEEKKIYNKQKEQIIRHFNYYYNWKIPQWENNAVSSFLWCMYLFELDLEFEEICLEFKISWKYVRYVDDIKLIIDWILDKEQILKIINRFEIILKNKLWLILNNNKTDFFYIKNENDFLEKVNENILWKTSFEEVVYDKWWDPLYTFIKKINTKEINHYDNIISELDYINELKDISFKNNKIITISNFFDKQTNINFRKVIYGDKDKMKTFESKLTSKVFPYFPKKYKQFISLVFLSDSLILKYYEYLVNNFSKNTTPIQYIELIEYFIEEINNKKETLVNKKEKIKENKEKIENYKKIIHELFLLIEDSDKIKLITKKVHSMDNYNFSEYYDCFDEHIYEIIYLHQVSIKQEDYNSALNYLNNIIHRIAFMLNGAGENNKHFEISKIVDIFKKHKIPTKYILEIEKINKRRNKNIVSHSGLNERSRSVTYEEYIYYKNNMFNFLSFIKSNNIL